MQTTELRKQLGCTDGQLTAILHQWNKQSSVRVDPLSDEVPDNVANNLINLHQSNGSKRLKADKKAVTQSGTPPQPKAINLEDIETLDWSAALDSIGTDEQTALALVDELEMNPQALTIADCEVLRELAIAENIQTELARSAQSLHDAQLGSFNEALEMAVDANLSQAELIGQAGLNAYLQESLRQTEIAHQVKTKIYTDAIQSITDQMALLGAGQQSEKIGTPRPNDVIQGLGKAATLRQNIANRKRQARASRRGNYLN